MQEGKLILDVACDAPSSQALAKDLLNVAACLLLAYEITAETKGVLIAVRLRNFCLMIKKSSVAG